MLEERTVKSWKHRLKRLPMGKIALMLCAGLTALSLSFSLQLSATGSGTTATLSTNAAADSGPVLATVAPPATAAEFARSSVDKLAADAPFSSWKNAQLETYPLGPGTHSWLVNVMNGGQRVGYLIISAAADGGYVLSEYGAGTEGLPYSMTDLRRYLVQSALIPSSYSGTLDVTALYGPLLPVWKIKLGTETLYIHAAVPQVLPWGEQEAAKRLGAQTVVAPAITSFQPDAAPVRSTRSGGPDDPYADLSWLSAPKLSAAMAERLVSAIPPGGSLAYQAAGRNDSLGSPFMITGSQRWSTGAGQPAVSAAVMYAATGPGGRRYLPLAVLQQAGSLHLLPLQGPAVVGFRLQPPEEQ
ncbi:hypothetical protein [Paenibacillus donghaensis]|uniref:Uncharacterized protein n=1 Tax=Paenibacillus donghaensis TaxID=414771 RepID=A0A2Z2KF54_9BACL|nr:hypothetical protein [Paenibacillus donghaensis]ASA20719.1 hypothetical protein B9T62_07910 [Paenibacillus donghaensis]